VRRECFLSPGGSTPELKHSLQSRSPPPRIDAIFYPSTAARCASMDRAVMACPRKSLTRLSACYSAALDARISDNGPNRWVLSPRASASVPITGLEALIPTSLWLARTSPRFHEMTMCRMLSSSVQQESATPELRSFGFQHDVIPFLVVSHTRSLNYIAAYTQLTDEGAIFR
jgi:hypothetical protein